jgi:transposase
MQVIYERCAGIDVHKRTVVVCVLVTAPDGSVQREVQTFGTMTADLLALSDWLGARAVRHVAMESTGVFWKPVYNLLEEGRTILLVNPQHLQAVPGRKTDVRDSEWLADLLRHGLLTASFIPPQPVRDLRELTRYRATLVQERAQEVNRLQQVLESANLKLAAVATDVLGKSGRAMLEALLGGEQDPDTLAELARGRLRAKLPELRQALEGRVRPVHLVQLRVLLAHIEFLEGALVQLQQEIAQRLDPFAEAVALAQTLPGIGETAASALIAELGTDMSRFPTHKHLASWAGVCPGNKQSGGKRLSSKTTHGSPWLRSILAEVAWAISHTTDNYLAAQFHRLARRLGKQKAVVAVSHSVLVILYHMLRDHRPYHDLGPDYFAQLDRQRLERLHVRRLEQLGYTVTLTPAPAA